MIKFPTVWEPYSPNSLLDICVKFCIKNPETFCTYNPVQDHYTLRDGVTLPTEICERLLRLSVEDLNRVVDDNFLRIFTDTSATRLKQVNLHGTTVSDDGIEIICRHSLVELDISQCLKLTERTLALINQLRSDLLSLTIIGNTTQIFRESIIDADANASHNQNGGSKKNIYQEQGILNTPFLRRLVIHGLEVHAEKDYFPLLLGQLPFLTHLDLSSCRQVADLSYLVGHKNLVSLVLYNVPHLQDAIPSICKITSLRHLDVSQVNEKRGHYKHPNQTLRQIVENLVHLTSLDISGTNLAGSGVQERDSPLKDASTATEDRVEVPLTDIPGLKSRVNCPLEFLGLFNTAHEACYRHHIPSKRIAGDANEEQILTAAQVYYDRPEILQKVLNDLFHVFRYDSCNNSRLALDVVMVAMKQHLEEKHIQIAGSASLFYIVKGEERNHFNISIKRRIIKALLDAMCAHCDDTTMLRNGCLTLIHFKIPQDLFDYERLVDILLHIVSQENQDDFVQRIGIYLLNSVACQVDGIQKQLVGDRGAITIMLRLIENRLDSQNCDEVMETAWSTMWNVTDETPANCQRFLDGKGMDLFLGCLKSFPDKPELLRNMMGLLGNVAEVKSLRSRLMKDQYLSVFSELLESTSDGIEVSYNAAGILSHIASDGPEAWNTYNINSVQRDEVLWKMFMAIERWKLTTKRNINYRSFEPILRLLNVDHTPEVQHWAVWALANLTRVYSDKYCSLLKEEGGLQMLEDLLTRPKPYDRIKKLARLIIDQCERYERLGSLDGMPENQD